MAGIRQSKRIRDFHEILTLYYIGNRILALAL